MNKPLIIGGGLTLVALGVAPYFVGTHAQTEIESVLAKLNENPVYSAKVISYEKGWFHSNAKIEFGFDVESFYAMQDIPTEELEQLEQAKFSATLDVAHGPLYVGDTVGLGLAQFNLQVAAEEAREYIEWEADTPLYHIIGDLGLFGGVNYTDEIASFTAADEEEGVEVKFSGYQGEGVTKGDVLHYESTASSFEIIDEELSISMADMKISMDWAADIVAAFNGEMFDSTVVMDIANVTVNGTTVGDSDIVLAGIKLDTTTAIDKEANQASTSFEYAMQSVTAPDFEASDLVIAIAANHLDMDFINAYQKFTQDSVSMAPEEIAQRVETLVDTNLLPMLKASPELNITKLGGTLPEGSFEGFMNTKLVDVEALPVVLEDPAFWLTHILADATVTADEALVQMAATSYMKSQLAQNPQTASMTEAEIAELAAQQVPMVISMFSQQGFIKQEGEKYVTQFALKEGKAQVNGTEIPLPIGG